MATTGGIRVEVRRGKNESTTSFIRRFTRRAQTLGIVRAVRNDRYWKRAESKNVSHKRALVSKARREAYNEQVKLGKIDPTARKRRKH